MYPSVGEFYYHFKHKPENGVLDYAYEFIGIGIHTETEQLLAIYKPLYENNHATENGADYCVRPLDMFIESVTKPEYHGPRFRKMTPQEVELVQVELKKQYS